MLRAHIGGITFDGSIGALSSGFMIAPDGWSGWDDGVGIRRDEVVRPVAHGAFDAQGYLAPRVITIAGSVLSDSAYDLRSKIARLTGLLADGGIGRLSVETDLETTWADVRLAAATKATVVGATNLEADFQVQLWAPSPCRYGEVVSFLGPTAQVLNRGNFPATPMIEITGTLPTGYMVASQGLQFIVSQPLVAGQTHRIDMSTGWLYRNGTLQAGQVAVAETFTIPPKKVTPVVFTPQSGNGSMTVKVTDTFV